MNFNTRSIREQLSLEVAFIKQNDNIGAIMKGEEFEKFVKQALVNLPSFFKEKLDNVDIVVEEWASSDIAIGRLLLGLYQGVPKPKRGTGYTLVLPDKITIFKGPIEFLSRGEPESIKNLITDTVQHELAHHFGISDARLRELKK